MKIHPVSIKTTRCSRLRSHDGKHAPPEVAAETAREPVTLRQDKRTSLHAVDAATVLCERPFRDARVVERVTPPAHDSSADTDRLLTAEEVAHLLGVTKRWVRRRARRLPFARHISVWSVRYSEAG